MADLHASPSIDDIMALAPVIPVLVIDRVEDARPIAEALVAGGLPAIEVTLRTEAALDVIRAMADVPGAVIGAGTVLNPAQLDAARAAGARFAVSPGFTAILSDAAGTFPWLPGVATAGEIMRALDHGRDRLKFFPAMAAGGPAALCAMTAVFRQARFCPTGGINEQNAAEWLAIPGVRCIGGSWLAPPGDTIDPALIRGRARAAAALHRT